MQSQDLDMLLDPFFQRQRADSDMSWRDRDRFSRDSDEFVDLVIGAIPDTDNAVSSPTPLRVTIPERRAPSLPLQLDVWTCPRLSCRPFLCAVHRRAPTWPLGSVPLHPPGLPCLYRQRPSASGAGSSGRRRRCLWA